MEYLVCFVTSCFFLHCAEKESKKNKHSSVLICIFLSIMAPCLLAGFRGLSVGTDVGEYLINNFNLAISATSLKEYIDMVYSKEPLYLILVYFCAKLSGNIHSLMFMIEAIIMCSILVGCWRMRDTISPTLVLCIYYLLFFNESLNLMRQAIAASIIFQAVSFLLNNKYIVFSLWGIVAFLFHKSAIVFVPIMIVHWFINTYSLGKTAGSKFIRIVLVILVVILFCFGFGVVLRLCVNLGFLNPRYLLYLEKASVSDSLTDNLVYLFELFSVLLFKKYIKCSQKDFFITNLVSGISVLQLSRFIYYGSRLSMYFFILNLVFIGEIFHSINTRSNKAIVAIGIIAIGLAYWFYIFYLGNAGETFPYVFYC